MSSFNESDHPRAGDGKFASKGPAAEAADVRLDAIDAQDHTPSRRDVLADSWADKEDWELDHADPDEVEVMTDPTDRAVIAESLDFEGLDVNGLPDDEEERGRQIDEIAKRTRQIMFAHDGGNIGPLQDDIEHMLRETTEVNRWGDYEEDPVYTRDRRRYVAGTLATFLATRKRVSKS